MLSLADRQACQHCSHENCRVKWYVPSTSPEGCTDRVWGMLHEAAEMVSVLGETAARLLLAHAADGTITLHKAGEMARKGVLHSCYFPEKESVGC